MNLALIGTGVMGQALIGSAWQNRWIGGSSLRLFDVDTEKAAAFAENLGALVCDSAADAAAEADIVLLAVKPAVVAAVLGSVQECLREGTTLISIAAGITLATLRELAGPLPAIARAMPNMPARVGKGVTAVCFDQAQPEQKKDVLEFFNSCGMSFEIREDLMDAVTGLSGSGPAYGLLIIEALADAGVLLGLPHETALKMAAMTLEGAARLLLESGEHPARLKDQVCTPGGTTIEALLSLEEDGVRAALMRAVQAAADKSRVLREKAGHG